MDTPAILMRGEHTDLVKHICFSVQTSQHLPASARARAHASVSRWLRMRVSERMCERVCKRVGEEVCGRVSLKMWVRVW